MKFIGFAGWSGSGKTTLIEQVVTRLERRGLVVSLIKHAHHEFEIDYPDKDSFRHRHAGCREVLVTSANRWALMHELGGDTELTLAEALSRLSPCDVVLIEGFKHGAFPKIEVYRPAIDKPALYPHDPHVIAVASDARIDTHLPRLDIDNPEAIAEFVVATLALAQPATGLSI